MTQVMVAFCQRNESFREIKLKKLSFKSIFFFGNHTFIDENDTEIQSQQSITHGIFGYSNKTKIDQTHTTTKFKKKSP